ncbi:MAG: hypothetical protein FJY85_13635 [Deltaproteobacteria bacterium]|nr:hypothetical protein [Deltaproteobacteria bacterium]
MNWREAYFAQAWSDFQVFQQLNVGRHPLCHKLHYLQMATEKLAKGFLCDPKSPPPKKSHFEFVRFLKVSKGRPDLRSKLGYERNYRAYASYVDSLLPLAEKIEDLAPVGSDFRKVNPEYPWIDDRGGVRCPALYDFAEFGITELAKIQPLISSLFRVIGFH